MLDDFLRYVCEVYVGGVSLDDMSANLVEKFAKQLGVGRRFFLTLEFNESTDLLVRFNVAADPADRSLLIRPLLVVELLPLTQRLAALRYCEGPIDQQRVRWPLRKFRQGLPRSTSQQGLSRTKKTVSPYTIG